MFIILKHTLPTSRSTESLLAVIMVLFLMCFLTAPAPAAAQAASASTLEHGGKDQNAAEQEVELNIKGAKVTISNLLLRDQEGRQVRFYSDLIKGKVVVLSFFYTSCKYICTMQGKAFSDLQSLLGKRLGKSVFLISVTTDPVNDNPEQLKAWGARYGLKPGWTLVTGEESEMNKILIKFTGSKAGQRMHLGAIFIGNDRTGLWTSAAGVFAPRDLLSAIDYIERDDKNGSK